MKTAKSSNILDKSLVISFLFLLLGLVFFSGIRNGYLPGPFMWLNHWVPWRDPSNINLGNFLSSDQVSQFYPMLNYAKLSLAQGDIPFWNSSMAFGIPFFQLIIIGHLFPLAALALLFPIQFTWVALAILKFIFIGLFTYKLLRLYKLREGSAFLGATAISFSYYSTVWAGDYLSFSFSSIPFFLYSISKFAYEGKSRVNKLLLYFSLIFLILGAFSSITFYGVFVGFIYALATFRTKLFSSDGIHFIFTVVLAVLTCCIPLYYTAEYLSLIDLNWQTNYGNTHLPFRDALLLVFPEFFGNYHEALLAGYGTFNEKTAYSSIFIFFLSGYSAALLLSDLEYRSKLTAWFWLIIQIWSISMVYGYFGINELFNSLPLFNSNSNIKLLGIVALSTSISGALAINHLLNKETARRRALNTFLAYSAFFILFIFFILSHQAYNIKNPWHIFSQVSVLIFCLGLLYSSVASLNSTFKSLTVLALIIITFTNQRQLGKEYNNYYEAKDFYRKTESIEFLTKNLNSSEKIITLDKAFLPSTPIFYGLSSVETRWFVNPEQRKLIKKLDSSYRETNNIQHFFNELDLTKNQEIYDFLNIRYLTYEKDAYPDLKLSPDWELKASFKDGLNIIENKVRPYHTEEPTKACSDTDIYSYTYKNDLIKFKTNRCASGIVKLPIWNFPGWTLMNQETQSTLSANEEFITVSVPEGISEIELNFRPRHLGVLLILTCFTLLISTLFILIRR